MFSLARLCNMASASSREPKGKTSMLAGVYFRVLQNKRSALKRVDITAEELKKHAKQEYKKWFTTEPGHKEATSELNHLCDIIVSSTRKALRRKATGEKGFSP